LRLAQLALKVSEQKRKEKFFEMRPRRRFLSRTSTAVLTAPEDAKGKKKKGN